MQLNTKTLLLGIAFITVGFSLLYTFVPTSQPTPATPQPKQVQEECVKTGCSSHVCLKKSLASDLATTCEFLPEYTCYANAVCELQPSGECGFSPSAELTSCLESAKTQELY